MGETAVESGSTMGTDVPVVPTITDAVRLRIEPGDVIVLRVPGPVSSETAKSIAAQAREVFGQHGIDCPVLILDGGMDLTVLHKAKPLGISGFDPLDDFRG